MHLWNDYEGTTLAGQWKLGRLLRTEGRSALFATTQADGSPAVLRLTESLNDQAVLQARYLAIQAAGDRYLIAVNSFGDAELDGAPLSYAVLEPTQESLADIVANRRLALEEMHEVATVVAGGLLALHGQGLVHGLVEPESVLAAGDRIKLRSDCARPAPSAEDAALEGAITTQTDAHGLAGIIYRALTQARLHDAADALALPEPFATIVRNTARGAWGVPQIEAELERYNRAHAPVIPASSVAPVPARPPVPSRPTSAPVAPAAPTAPLGTSVPVAKTAAAKAAPILFESTAPVAAPLSSRAKLEASAEGAWEQPKPVSSSRLRLILIAAGAILLLLLAFLMFHHKANSGVARAAAVTPAALEGAAGTRPLALASPFVASAAPAPPAAAHVAGEKVWRVVAYTYNRQSAADRKAESLNGQFPGFDAQVWSHIPAKGPFLVILGGEMPKDEASAMRAKARKAGVAPDIYEQSYTR